MADPALTLYFDGPVVCVWPLRVGILRRPWSALYRFIARHRYRLSGLFGIRPSASCDSGVCRRDGTVV